MQTVSTNICERTSRSQERSEFQHGAVIGHLCNKSSREVSSLLNIPQSTVSGIITKWKQLGTTATQPRSGRPRNLTEWGQQMLRCRVRQGRQLSAESIATDLQTSCGLQISSRTVCRKLRGQAAASKLGLQNFLFSDRNCDFRRRDHLIAKAVYFCSAPD